LASQDLIYFGVERNKLSLFSIPCTLYVIANCWASASILGSINCCRMFLRMYIFLLCAECVHVSFHFIDDIICCQLFSQVIVHNQYSSIIPLSTTKSKSSHVVTFEILIILLDYRGKELEFAKWTTISVMEKMINANHGNVAHHLHDEHQPLKHWMGWKHITRGQLG
jgi:hypothetical protein